MDDPPTRSPGPGAMAGTGVTVIRITEFAGLDPGQYWVFQRL